MIIGQARQEHEKGTQFTLYFKRKAENALMHAILQGAPKEGSSASICKDTISCL